MAQYQIAWNAGTRVATIQLKGTALPASSTNIGEYTHAEAGDPLEDNPTAGGVENHVHFHHVRDALYLVGVQDMQRVSIEDGVTPIPVASISITPSTVLLANGATHQIVPSILPANATNKEVTYTSELPARATVSPTGLVTAGAEDGGVVITATTLDGNFSDTLVVTTS